MIVRLADRLERHLKFAKKASFLIDIDARQARGHGRPFSGLPEHVGDELWHSNVWAAVAKVVKRDEYTISSLHSSTSRTTPVAASEATSTALRRIVDGTEV